MSKLKDGSELDGFSAGGFALQGQSELRKIVAFRCLTRPWPRGPQTGALLRVLGLVEAVTFGTSSLPHNIRVA